MPTTPTYKKTFHHVHHYQPTSSPTHTHTYHIHNACRESCTAPSNPTHPISPPVPKPTIPEPQPKSHTHSPTQQTPNKHRQTKPQNERGTPHARFHRREAKKEKCRAFTHRSMYVCMHVCTYMWLNPEPSRSSITSDTSIPFPLCMIPPLHITPKSTHAHDVLPTVPPSPAHTQTQRYAHRKRNPACRDVTVSRCFVGSTS